MSIWIFRLSTLIAFSFLAYRFILHTWMGFLGGLLCGAIVLAGEVIFKKLRLIKIMIACVGLLIGYVLFGLFSYEIYQLASVVPHLITNDVVNFWVENSQIIEIFLLVFGVIACLIKARDLEGISYAGSHLIVADKTALIDGRLVDLCEMGFLSGVVVVPVFVVDALNKQVASNDPLERANGKRGLDIVAKLQESSSIEVRITNASVQAGSEEEKIAKLAKKIGAKIITLSFQVAKEAALKNVVALNVADLSVALKPIVLPGGIMNLFIMKEGKEKEQGIGYLDDGTMVVVEEARRSVGKRIEVVVYSILQTSTGKMIFAKTK